jgi:hypothetical protein
MKYRFITENKDWSFDVIADNSDEAFNEAYSIHGPQVEDMFYFEILPDLPMYDEVVEAFSKYMKRELEANFQKGDRNGAGGWLEVKDNKFWISELYYHVGKLQSAMMSNDIHRIEENCADIANLALMTLDVKIDLLKKS